MTLNCNDKLSLDQWYPIAAVAQLQVGKAYRTSLMDATLSYSLEAEGRALVQLRDEGAVSRVLASQLAYGYIWTSLGDPDELFAIAEYGETNRRSMHAATIGVRTSAPRAVENFLDMGHFPFVHTDILGAEPHTEVKEYDVEFDVQAKELIATRCRFVQPKAAPSSTGSREIEYVYRVPHPFCSVLYKSSGEDPSRKDVIALFLQPLTEESVLAHMMVSIVDSSNSERNIRSFQQVIFAQDKPILENQFPKRLPLDPRAETPIRADKSSVFYRRWLRELGITYSVIR